MVNWPDTDQVSRCTDALQQSSEVNRSMNWLALDIGGANIKIADGLGYAATIPFALWKSPGELSNVLETILAVAPTGEHLAVTMTGELADCFASKTEGVQHIVRHTLVAAGDRSVRFYLHDRTLAPAESVLAQPLLAAASNWLALARFAGRYCEHSSAVLIDIGSTTSDIVPILDGVPRPMGHSDTQRLLHGELVYTGVMRSPVCAIVGSFPYRNQFCPVSQELFATSRDIYLLLQELPEDPNCTNTADSRPATRVHARQRMARMICAEPNEFSSDDALLATSTHRRGTRSRAGTHEAAG